LEELIDDLNICLDESYLSSDEVTALKKQARSVLILLNGYLRHLRSRSAVVRESNDRGNESDPLVDGLPL
jgi:hypothetical protein